MAETIRRRATQQAERTLGHMTSKATDMIDKAATMVANAPDRFRNLPESVKARVEGIPDNARKKADFLLTNIEAKQMLQDRLYDTEDHNEQEFLQRLADDPQLRKTVEQIVKPALNPTPVSADPMMKENGYINLGAGVSTFWKEMQQKTPIELEELEQLDNILMGIEMGLDKDLEPDTRKTMLKAVGFDQEQVDSLVPLSDYVEYEDRVKENIRAQMAEQMGLDPENLSPEDAAMVDMLAEDALMNAKLTVDPEEMEQGPDYEETYGYSMEEIHEMFGDEAAPEGMPSDAPVDDRYWDQYMEAPLDEMAEVYGGSMEENIQQYNEMMETYAQEQRGDLDLRPEDFDFANGYEPPQITDEDLAFAEAWAQEDGLGEL